MNFSQKSVFTISGKFFGAFLALLSSIFLARYLGVGGVGQYQLLISTQVIAITIITMGFGNASIFFINFKKIDKTFIISNILKFFTPIAIVFVIIFALCIFSFEEYFGHIQYYSIFIYAMGSGTLLLYSLMLPILYISLEVVKIQILGLTSTLLFLSGIVLLYHTAFLNIDIVLILLGISNIIPFMMLMIFLKDDFSFKPQIDYSLIKEIFIYGIKISATNLVFLLSSNLIIFLLKSLLDEGFEAVGLFSRATAITGMFVLIPSSIGPLIYSKWSKTNIKNLHLEVEKTLRILLFISFVSVLTLFIFGKYILTLLYGIEFIGAAPALSILSISVIFTSIVMVLTNLFSSIGKPMITLSVFFISLIISVLLGIILIPFYDISGAAIAVLIGLVINALGLLYFARKEIFLKIESIIFLSKNDIKYIRKTLHL